MRARVMLALVLFFWLPAMVVFAQTPTPVPRVEITSPLSGAQVGGIVSVLGSVEIAGLRSYALAFGPGKDPVQWIEISQEYERSVVKGRLAFWDTTKIPDGLYTLRLRAVWGAGVHQYRDFYVGPIQVSNVPRLPSPAPTTPPTSTPTQTPLPTLTLTPGPTLALDDAVSPFIYVTQMDQYDPLCLNWRQRYSIWVSNVGMITVTNVVLTDVLPLSCQPVLEGSTEGAAYDDQQSVTWIIGSMRPGEARKYELQISVASWLEVGKWIANKVILSSDQVPEVVNSEQSLLSDCAWLKKTGTAAPFTMPTAEPSPTRTPTKAGTGASKPTLLPSSTPLSLSIPDKTVSASLDLLTLVISVSLGILLVVTAVLVYRRATKRK